MTVKKPFAKRLTQYLGPRVIKWILILIGPTCRKEWFGLENIEGLKKLDRNWIFTTWHNNSFFDSLLLRNHELTVMVSYSKDGNMATDLLESMGYKTIRGSTSKGGTKALMSMIKEMRQGQIGAITPDGPRGPRYEMQMGAIAIAQHSRTPLVPIHTEATRQWILEKSWAKFKLPKPFSRIVISIGKPFSIPDKLTKAEREIARKEFEMAMMTNVEKTKTLILQRKEGGSSSGN